MKTLIIAVTMALAGTATARAQSAGDDFFPSITHTDVLPRQPNVFRDCWEPVPAYCVRPPGLLWFGSPARWHQHQHHHHGRPWLARHP